MLQGKSYIKFAQENCVDVIALSHWEQALKEGHRTQTFKAPDEFGDEVEWLLLYPTLQPSDLERLYNAKTVSFNKTGIMPYTAIVDPYTEEEMIGVEREQCTMKNIMDATRKAKKTLNEKHGPSASRKTVAAVRAKQDEIQDLLYEGEVDAAMAAFRKLQKSVAKEPKGIRELARGTWDIIVETAEARLKEAERLLDEGRKSEALRVLKPLARALEGTALSDRIETLAAKARAP